MSALSFLVVLLAQAQLERTSIDEGEGSMRSEERAVLEQLRVSKRIEGLSIPEKVFIFDGTPAAQPPGRTASFVPRSIIDARIRRLRSVVRLTDALGELQCTGTLVRREGLPPAILTAAHCLFDTQKRSDTNQVALGSPRTELWVNGQRMLLDARLVTVPAGFRTCATQRLTFRECVMVRHQPDVAFITAPPRLVLGPNAPEPWNVAGEDMMTGLVVALGYGLNRMELPDEVLRGNLRTTDEAPGCARWANEAGSGQMVDFGDSGGPVVTSQDDEALMKATPTVIGVVSGQLAPGPFTLTETPEQVARFRARLQRPGLECVQP
ncbi:hypothetical protein D7W82_01195 [Corallococcus sp. CA049B]|uniref:trypsin-like serine protease n=1 Tax=Corallococcus sp. CA049B TaxID=2316730 RepID=UPI000EA23088|nr:trypsin-like serine protease [Corallococcus sp. CA049B]NOJ91502.1 trypsin-like serine protease [Corallococcus coralloides]RKG91230.1 hypothetical protein D7W82_01195 [Corallococcus sp. CA049B]